MLVKQDLSTSIPKQIDQGTRVVTMSTEVMPDKPAVLEALKAANADLLAKQNAAIAARAAAKTATAEARASAVAQRAAFANLAGYVNTLADGSEAYIYSTGLLVRATPVPIPPVTDAPTEVRAGINGVPGRVTVIWKGLYGARVYEVQHTTDLSGATGWISAIETPGKCRLEINGLTSGTKYAFRVRALANGQPGPWSGPVQQMAA